MGSTQSSQSLTEEEEEREEYVNGVIEQREEVENQLMKKVLQQEPEMLPCHASASPLSPQLSTVGTPRRLGSSSIKVWDPCNVLGPPSPPPPPPPPLTTFSRSFSSDTLLDEDQTMITEVFLISHGECGLNLRPDLISGRSPEAAAALTQIGKRQARALAVLLSSQGIRFNAVYSSPLDRTRTTAVSVCQELNFEEEQIQSSNELLEVSHGQWEGCTQSEIYNPEMLSLMEKFQPDFSAPSGESLRQVEFRMIQFLNDKVLRLTEKLRLVDLSSSFQHHHHNDDSKGLLTRQNSQVHDRDDGTILHPPTQTHSELLYTTRQRSGLSRKKSGKSRLQFMKTTGNSEDYDDNSCNETNSQDHFQEVNGRSSFSVGVFSHAVPIKCLVTALLGCSPAMSHKICIDDSSITVLQHSLKTGWQIKRVNDTAHLRLL